MSKLTIEDMKNLLAPGKPADPAVVGSVARELLGVVEGMGKALSIVAGRLKMLEGQVAGGAGPTETAEAEGDAPAPSPAQAAHATQMGSMSEDQLRDLANSSKSQADAIMDAAIAAQSAEKAGTAPPPQPAPAPAPKTKKPAAKASPAA